MDEKNQLAKVVQEKIKRPLFITILAIAHIIGGGIFFILAIIGVFLPNYFSITQIVFGDYLLYLGQTSWVLIAVYLVSSSLAFISGIGMWKGSKLWGWHLGTLYYAYNLFRNFNILFYIGNVFEFLPHEILTTVQNPEYDYYNYIIRIVIYSVIYIIFFFKKIGKYFNVNPEKNYLVIIVQFLICILIVGGLRLAGG